MSARRKLPPLNALKAFEAAARLGGFTAAAEEMFVSPGAISRHVTNLEEFLGVTLFQRGHNDVRLTADGADYLAQIAAALSAIEKASRGVATPARDRNLHIHALPTFAEYWLMPRLGRFRDAHPDASIQLTSSLEETDWDTDSADVSIYASIGGWNERGTHLFDSEISPVCAPSLVQGVTPIPADLMGWPLLSSINKSNDWLRWFHAAGLQPDAAQPRYLFGSSAMAYKAAMHGFGAVCAELVFVEPLLVARSLVRLSDLTTVGSGYFFEVRPGKKESSLARAFREWIVAEAGE
ncbi:LysR family transcriptional regulator [Variovorax sp. WS11]|uniref:LysR substrate-binding domain-containing protein n=1 Tax=Variovorax sp. WS11 TaxID=1105204 RepID=UPI000D0D7AB8|nr:LysR substrate-binding domain-containing protein [Variovorax sp. WS11]NDZ17345.1 LysR family transcriptional regulator [Variovorax sp. WS11]PSL86115.1 LysR family transcriptional regulator [Variovorax sp. WS11]